MIHRFQAVVNRLLVGVRSAMCGIVMPARVFLVSRLLVGVIGRLLRGILLRIVGVTIRVRRDSFAPMVVAGAVCVRLVSTWIGRLVSVSLIVGSHRLRVVRRVRGTTVCSVAVCRA